MLVYSISYDKNKLIKRVNQLILNYFNLIKVSSSKLMNEVALNLC